MRRKRRRKPRRPKPWSNSARARDVMIERWRARATIYARGIVGATRATIPADELESAAMWGLLQAVDRFDPERGARFGTYLYHKVRSAVYEHIRDACYRADRSHVRFHSLESLEEQTRNAVDADEKSGGGARAQEVMTQRGLSSASDSATLQLMVAPERETAAERHERAELAALAMGALRNHTRLRKIVRLRFYEGKTLREVGTRMGFSEQRAMQLVHRALRMMREDLDARGINGDDIV